MDLHEVGWVKGLDWFFIWLKTGTVGGLLNAVMKWVPQNERNFLSSRGPPLSVSWRNLPVSWLVSQSVSLSEGSLLCDNRWSFVSTPRPLIQYRPYTANYLMVSNILISINNFCSWITQFLKSSKQISNTLEDAEPVSKGHRHFTMGTRPVYRVSWRKLFWLSWACSWEDHEISCIG
jgi:hypothetical protein